MDIRFDKTPGLFSPFHIIMLVVTIVAVVLFVILVKKKSEDSHIKLIKWLGSHYGSSIPAGYAQTADHFHHARLHISHCYAL